VSNLGKTTKKNYWIPAGILLFCLTLSGCAPMADGVAALTGHGGEIARADAMPIVKSLALELAPQQPQPLWQQIFPQEAADFAVFVDADRLLVGAVESGGYLGVPDFKELLLYDTTVGKELWRTERPEIRNGSYSVLATSPVLVLEGKAEGFSILLAYDIKTGKKLWERQQPHAFKSFVAQDALLVASYGAGEWSMEKLNPETGSPFWSRKVKTATADNTPREVFLSGKDVILISKEMHKLDVDSGTIAWAARLPWDNFKFLSIHRRPEGYLVAGAEGAALLDGAKGELLWSEAGGKAPIRLVSVSGDNLYLVRIRGALLAGSLPGVEGQSEIEYINLKKGKSEWRYTLGSEVVSPLIIHDDTLFFATTDSLVGLLAKNGRKLFVRSLDKDIVAGSPKNVRRMGQPDILHIRGDKLFLARERYGIQAFSLTDGKFLWAQPHYLSPLNNFYTADHQYAVLIASLEKYGHLDKKNTVPATSGAIMEYRRSAILQSMQRSADNAIARADATRNTPGTSSLGRQLASTGKIAGIESNIIAARMEQSQRAMQASFDLLNASFNFNAALAEALKQKAEQGLFERLHMQSSGSVAAWQAAFQGHYYLWPFQERGRGVTLVDLDKGKREDLIYAPMIAPVTDFGIDLPTFALSPDQKTLIAFGVPLDHSIHQEYVKWKWRMPRPAVLAYTLDRLPFSAESRSLKHWEENLKTDLVEWAFRGDAAKVRELIGSGVNVNMRKYGLTPLLTAIANKHETVVRVLVENRADVNLANETGVKPLALAKAVDAPESIVQILRQAGAN